MKYAVVNKETNIVDNIIIGSIPVSENYELIELEENSKVSCGWIRSGNTFIQGE